MVARCQCTRPLGWGRRILCGCATLALLAAGLGEGVRVAPPMTDANRESSLQSTSGIQLLPPTTDTEEQIFVTEAGQMNLLEARLGELALQTSNRPAVQDYARRMLAEHARLREELAVVAGNSHFIVPAHLDEPNARTVARLAALRGEDFDRAYLGASVSDLEAGIAAFENEAAGTTMSGVALTPVVDWAYKTVPLLNAQFALGQSTAQKL